VLHKNNILINTLIDENKSQVILRIVPVKITGKTTIETYALWVETSTTTLIDHQTAKCKVKSLNAMTHLKKLDLKYLEWQMGQSGLT
jgi:hypothetical protein